MDSPAFWFFISKIMPSPDSPRQTNPDPPLSVPSSSAGSSNPASSQTKIPLDQPADKKTQGGIVAVLAVAGRWGRQVWREFVATGAAFWTHSCSLFKTLSSLWRQHRLKKRLYNNRLLLGEAMFRLGLGEPRLHKEMEELEERIENIAEGKGSVRQLLAEKRGLLIKLSASGPPSPEVAENVALVRQVEKQIEEEHSSIAGLRPGLWPRPWRQRLRIGAAYAVVAGVALLSISHRPEAGQSAADEAGRKTGDTIARAGGAQNGLDPSARPAPGKEQPGIDETSIENERQAAEAGDPQAMLSLAGRLIESGNLKEIAEGVGWLHVAVEAGDVESMALLSTMYLQNIQLAAEYKKLQSSGKAGAKQKKDLADFAKYQKLFPSSMEEVLGWLEKGAEAHHPPAMFALGTIQLEGTFPKYISQDVDRGLAWIRQAAEAGDPEAMYTLGNFYNSGIVFRKKQVIAMDKDEAVRWLKKVAKSAPRNSKIIISTYPAAMYKLGLIYLDRCGFKKKGVFEGADGAEALYWFRKACRGNRIAQQIVSLYSPPLIPSEGAGPGKWVGASMKSLSSFTAAFGNAKEKKRMEGMGELIADIPPVVKEMEMTTFSPLPFCEAGISEMYVKQGDTIGIATFITPPKGKGKPHASTGDTPIQQLFSDGLPLSLDTEQQAKAYLYLHCRSIQGGGSNFVLVDHPDFLPWHWSASEGQLDEIRKKFKALELKQLGDGSWEGSGTVQHGRDLFLADFKLHPNGKVEMPEDQLIARNLPLFVEKYENGLRLLVAPDLSSKGGK